MPTRNAIPSRATRVTGTVPVTVQRRRKRFVSNFTFFIPISLAPCDAGPIVGPPFTTGVLEIGSKYQTIDRAREWLDFPRFHEGKSRSQRQFFAVSGNRLAPGEATTSRTDPGRPADSL